MAHEPHVDRCRDRPRLKMLLVFSGQMHEVTVMDKEKEHMSRLKDAVEMKVNNTFSRFYRNPDEEFWRSAGTLMVLFVCPTSQTPVRSLLMGQLQFKAAQMNQIL